MDRTCAFTLAFFFLPVALLGCGTGSIRQTLRPPEGCIATNDSLVVPGCRIGAVTLGMTEADLVKAWGVPDHSMPFTDANGAHHSYSSRHARVTIMNGRVDEIIAFKGSPFSTTEGIREGSSELEARLSLGDPVWKMHRSYPGDGAQWVYCYADATSVYVGGISASDSGRVRGFGINACRP